MPTYEAGRALERLQAAGKRITPERELLLRIIDRNDHLDASEIYSIAKAELPNIGLATVYRTLNLLQELGVVKTSDLGQDHHHFEVQREDHVHLICAECGRVFDAPPPDELQRLANSKGFRVESSRLEMFGLCADCAKKHPPFPARRTES